MSIRSRSISIAAGLRDLVTKPFRQPQRFDLAVAFEAIDARYETKATAEERKHQVPRLLQEKVHAIIRREVEAGALPVSVLRALEAVGDPAEFGARPIALMPGALMSSSEGGKWTPPSVSDVPCLAHFLTIELVPLTRGGKGVAVRTGFDVDSVIEAASVAPTRESGCRHKKSKAKKEPTIPSTASVTDNRLMGEIAFDVLNRGIPPEEACISAIYRTWDFTTASLIVQAIAKAMCDATYDVSLNREIPDLWGLLQISIAYLTRKAGALNYILRDYLIEKPSDLYQATDRIYVPDALKDELVAQRQRGAAPFTTSMLDTQEMRNMAAEAVQQKKPNHRVRRRYHAIYRQRLRALKAKLSAANVLPPSSTVH